MIVKKTKQWRCQQCYIQQTFSRDSFRMHLVLNHNSDLVKFWNPKIQTWADKIIPLYEMKLAQQREACSGQTTETCKQSGSVFQTQ
jgi:hypothetical protein